MPLVTLRKRQKLHKLRRHRPITSRRRFLAQGVALLAVGATGSVWRLSRVTARASEDWRAPIRPPTASKDDAAFQAACVRCGLCGTVCENGCIEYFGVDETTHGALTPYLDVRRRSCTLCMRCTNICPTDALSPVEDDLDVIAETIDMGTAVVDPDRCLSYLGRVCGYCHDACPLPERAIRLIPPARPVVIADGCVGCGRCVELCPQSPTAIDVDRMVVS
ncbi:MAG: 4Fe-4S dicluster domain-containing protein [Sandaracinaceae bacterium]|nr:4Fe-4S dicluster domain-containing protein [Sandaracinaceae bacterium]